MCSLFSIRDVLFSHMKAEDLEIGEQRSGSLEKLVTFLKKQLSLIIPSCSADRIVEYQVSFLESGLYRGSGLCKELSIRGKTIFEYLRGKSEVQIHTILDGDHQQIFDRIVSEKRENMHVFHDISFHHQRLLSCSSDLLAIGKDSLLTYANAATIMGQKSWVIHGHIWMENMINDFFKSDGAAKCFIKKLKRFYMDRTGHPIPLELLQSIRALVNWDDDIIRGFPSNKSYCDCITIAAQKSQSSQKIAIVDVGSCYNPFSYCASAENFDVVALDLCPSSSVLPADGSLHHVVYSCDFLHLAIGDEGSVAIIESEDVIGGGSCFSLNDRSERDTDRVYSPSNIATHSLISNQPLQKRRKLEEEPSIRTISSTNNEHNDIIEVSVTPTSDGGDATINANAFSSFLCKNNGTNGKGSDSMATTISAAAARLESSNTPRAGMMLRQLPRRGSDVVVMSLVLSYLPSSHMRSAMIIKARQLLRDPGIDLRTLASNVLTGFYEKHADNCAQDLQNSSEVTGQRLLSHLRSVVDCGTCLQRTGLLIIYEKESALCTVDLVSNWIHAVEQRGFSLWKYEKLKDEISRRFSHAFVFNTASIDCSIDDLAPLTIKQDHDHYMNSGFGK